MKEEDEEGLWERGEREIRDAREREKDGKIGEEGVNTTELLIFLQKDL